MALDISKAINTSSQFVKNAAAKSKGLEDRKEMILRRAVVVDINRSGLNAGAVNLTEPPYAICAVILDEGIYAKRPDLVRKKIWYPPLLPLNNISIPEVGEEVFIIKEQNVKSSIGYWIGRVNNCQHVSYFGAKSWMRDESSKFPSGPIDINGMRRDSNWKTSKSEIQAIPVKDGDVIQQGRSGTYLRHSFDNLSNSAILELGVNAPISRKFDQTKPTLGVTRTKTLHTEQMPLNRIFDANELVGKPLKAYKSEGSPLFIHNNDDPFYSFNINLEAKNDSIINLAQKHINVSIESGTGNSIDNYLYRQVLGDRNKESLHQIIGTIKQLKELVVEIYELYKEHTHEIEGEVFNYDQTIGEDGGDVSIEFEIEDKDTEPIKEENILVEIDEKFEKFEETLIEVNNKLEDTLSSTQFVQ